MPAICRLPRSLRTKPTMGFLADLGSQVGLLKPEWTGLAVAIQPAQTTAGGLRASKSSQPCVDRASALQRLAPVKLQVGPRNFVARDGYNVILRDCQRNRLVCI